MQKSTVFYNLAMNNIKKPITFTRISKRIKHVGINFTKEVQDLYTKDYEIMLNKIEDLNKRKTSQVHGLAIQWPNIKMAVSFPKLIYRVNIIPIKIQVVFFCKLTS